MRMTAAQVDAHNERVRRGRLGQLTSEGDHELRREIARKIEREIGREGLQAKIIQEIERRGWLYIHARTDQPSTIQVGAPDFPVIYADRGRKFIVEVKATNKRLRLEQQRFHAHLRRLGHDPRTVDTFEGFLAVVDSE